MDQEIVFFLRFRKKRSLFRPKRHWLKKITKIYNFSKELVHGFCQKTGDFLIFSFYAKWIKRVFFEGSEGKEAFLDHKRNGSKNHPKFLFF